MQEVRDLTTGMREAMDFIRKSTFDARALFAFEVERARDNVSKIQSMAQQLKDANSEMETLLGNSGTNFPPSSEEKIESKSGIHGAIGGKPVTDLNGVTLNREASK